MKMFYEQFLKKAGNILDRDSNNTLQSLLTRFNKIMSAKFKIKTYVPLYVLGRGSFGKVTRCLQQYESKFFALKEIERNPRIEEKTFNIQSLKEVFICFTIGLKNPGPLLNIF